MPVEKTFPVYNQELAVREKQLACLLQKNSLLWKGRRHEGLSASASVASLSSGYQALDDILPWHGWPRHGLVEIIGLRRHVNGLGLVLPLLGSLSRQRHASLWFTPPYIPYAPALVQAGIAIEHIYLIPAGISCRENLWGLEKALQTTACPLVLAWLRQLNVSQLRRLQLAAHSGGTLGFLFHQQQISNSPAVLRLAIRSGIRPGTLDVQVVKARGSHRQASCQISMWEWPQ